MTEVDRVAPLAGARIEILAKQSNITGDRVAPLAGARIEIINAIASGLGKMSLPSRERGLKYKYEVKGAVDESRSPRGSAD